MRSHPETALLKLRHAFSTRYAAMWGYVEGKHNCRAKVLCQESIEGASPQMLNEVFWNNPKTMALLESTFDKKMVPSEHKVKLATLEKEKSEPQSQLA